MKRLAILAFCLAAVTSTVAQTNTPSYQGLWWNPSQSGWGMNIVHQGDILFATWFTYDKDGSGMWLVVPSAQLDPMYGMDNMYGMYGYYGNMGGSTMPSYNGTVYRTTGPAFNPATFDASKVQASAVGTVQFQFFDANDGSFSYTVGASSGMVNITRQLFGPMPACSFGTSSATSNFSDLWWRTGGTESGWGVNLAQEGDIIFATWFTYDAAGRGQWLVMPAGTKSGDLTWSGALYRTRGPAFDGTWDPSKVASTQVGTATFAFSDASNGTFTATVDGMTLTKPISRQVYASPKTVCQ